MKFSIIPFEGTDVLKLGLTSEENSRILNEKPKLFNKSDDPDERPTEEYSICHIYYDEEGKSEAIEFFAPLDLTFQNIQMLGVKPKKLFKQFKKLDPLIIDDSCEGFYSLKYSIATTECEGIIDGVMVARKGYFDFVLEESFFEDEIVLPAITEFHLLPFNGTKELKLGQTSAENQAILKIKPKLRPELLAGFDEEEAAQLPDPEDYGICYIYYDKDGKSNYIEFWEPAQVIYKEHNLIGSDSKHIHKIFKKNDPDIYFDNPMFNGFASPKYAMSILPDTDDTVQILGLGIKGYFKKPVETKHKKRKKNEKGSRDTSETIYFEGASWGQK